MRGRQLAYADRADVTRSGLRPSEEPYDLRVAIARLGLITMNCADQEALAAFWAGLLDGEIVYRAEDLAVVHTERGSLCALRVPEYQPPTWPAGDAPNHIHLDLAVNDLDGAQAAAVQLGARVADVQPGPDLWRVLLDPAGHPFCLTARVPLLPLGPRPEAPVEN